MKVASSNLFGNLLGVAMLSLESECTVDARTWYDTRVTLDEAHYLPAPDGLVLTVFLTVVADGTYECMAAAESSLKIPVTIGRCTGHSSGFELSTE